MPYSRYIVAVSKKKEPDNTDRLIRLEQLLEKNDRRGSRLSWIRWNPNSKYGYEIDDAREEVRWMVYEIKKLREENAELKSFVDTFREAVEEQIGGDGK
ncbi:MAG: hypothetical protein DRZ90_11255 [Spirochaetes bacterium]|nr:MAG: hypothetical protein DRZ90_11255 [Spirochaetota bacterium]